MSLYAEVSEEDAFGFRKDHISEYRVSCVCIDWLQLKFIGQLGNNTRRNCDERIKEFQAVLQIISSRLVQMIAKEMRISDRQALTLLYSSMLYEKLEREETKVWHLSVPTLFELFIEEQETGKIIFPEEA